MLIAKLLRQIVYNDTKVRPAKDSTETVLQLEESR